jgi:hypothetical protein
MQIWRDFIHEIMILERIILKNIIRYILEKYKVN